MNQDQIHLDDVAAVSQRLASMMDEYRIFLLSGSLGAGKTYLVQQWMKLIGITDQVTSPTFSLINEYRGQESLIYHMDMYRLKTTEEALGLGFMEMLDNPSAHLIIEWPELVRPLIDYKVVDVSIQAEEGDRVYVISTT